MMDPRGPFVSLQGRSVLLQHLQHSDHAALGKPVSRARSEGVQIIDQCAIPLHSVHTFGWSNGGLTAVGAGVTCRSCQGKLRMCAA